MITYKLYDTNGESIEFYVDDDACIKQVLKMEFADGREMYFDQECLEQLRTIIWKLDRNLRDAKIEQDKMKNPAYSNVVKYLDSYKVPIKNQGDSGSYEFDPDALFSNDDEK